MRSQRIKSVAPPVAPSRWGLFFSAAGPRGYSQRRRVQGQVAPERRPDRGTPQAHSPDRHRSARQGTQGKPRAPAIFLQHSQCCRFLGILRRLGGTWPGCRRRARETPEAQPAPDRPRSARWGTQEQPTPPAIYLPRWPTWQIVGDGGADAYTPIGCRWGTWLGCRRRAKRDGRAEWAGSKGPRGTHIPGRDLIRSQLIKSVAGSQIRGPLMRVPPSHDGAALS